MYRPTGHTPYKPSFITIPIDATVDDLKKETDKLYYLPEKVRLRIARCRSKILAEDEGCEYRKGPLMTPSDKRCTGKHFLELIIAWRKYRGSRQIGIHYTFAYVDSRGIKKGSIEHKLRFSITRLVDNERHKEITRRYRKSRWNRLKRKYGEIDAGSDTTWELRVWLYPKDDSLNPFYVLEESDNICIIANDKVDPDRVQAVVGVNGRRFHIDLPLRFGMTQKPFFKRSHSKGTLIEQARLLALQGIIANKSHQNEDEERYYENSDG